METIVVVLGSLAELGTLLGGGWTGRGEDIVFCSDFLRPFNCADTVRQRAEHREGPAALLQPVRLGKTPARMLCFLSPAVSLGGDANRG